MFGSQSSVDVIYSQRQKSRKNLSFSRVAEMNKMFLFFNCFSFYDLPYHIITWNKTKVHLSNLVAVIQAELPRTSILTSSFWLCSSCYNNGGEIPVTEVPERVARGRTLVYLDNCGLVKQPVWFSFGEEAGRKWSSESLQPLEQGSFPTHISSDYNHKPVKVHSCSRNYRTLRHFSQATPYFQLLKIILMSICFLVWSRSPLRSQCGK